MAIPNYTKEPIIENKYANNSYDYEEIGDSLDYQFVKGRVQLLTQTQDCSLNDNEIM